MGVNLPTLTHLGDGKSEVRSPKSEVRSPNGGINNENAKMEERLHWVSAFASSLLNSVSGLRTSDFGLRTSNLFPIRQGAAAKPTLTHLGDMRESAIPDNLNLC